LGDNTVEPAKVLKAVFHMIYGMTLQPPRESRDIAEFLTKYERNAALQIYRLVLSSVLSFATLSSLELFQAAAHMRDIETCTSFLRSKGHRTFQTRVKKGDESSAESSHNTEDGLNDIVVGGNVFDPSAWSLKSRISPDGVPVCFIEFKQEGNSKKSKGAWDEVADEFRHLMIGYSA